MPCRDNKAHFFSPKASRPTVGSLPARFLLSGYGGYCSGESNVRGGKTPSHIHRLPRLRRNGVLPPLLHTPSRCAEEQLHLRPVRIHALVSQYQIKTDKCIQILLNHQFIDTIYVPPTCFNR